MSNPAKDRRISLHREFLFSFHLRAVSSEAWDERVKASRRLMYFQLQRHRSSVRLPDQEPTAKVCRDKMADCAATIRRQRKVYACCKLINKSRSINPEQRHSCEKKVRFIELGDRVSDGSSAHTYCLRSSSSFWHCDMASKYTWQAEMLPPLPSRHS